MKVYVISLQSDVMRREIMAKRFDSFVNFCVIEAVDGRQMSAKEYFSYANTSFKAYKRLLSPAEIGCTLSHMKAYREFLTSGDDYALILEDDIIGDDSGLQKVQENLSKMSQDAIMICGAQDGLAGRFSAFGKALGDGMYEVSVHSYGAISRAAAYVVSRSSAERLLSVHEKAVCTTDVWEFLLKNNNLKMYFADIFAHPTDLSGSNIESERNERGYKPNFNAYVKSIKFIIFSRFEKIFCGYERIFK